MADDFGDVSCHFGDVGRRARRGRGATELQRVKVPRDESAWGCGDTLGNGYARVLHASSWPAAAATHGAARAACQGGLPQSATKYFGPDCARAVAALHAGRALSLHKQTNNLSRTIYTRALASQARGRAAAVAVPLVPRGAPRCPRAAEFICVQMLQ